jgi:thiol-disulfide isomerase/thioredoxin
MRQSQGRAWMSIALVVLGGAIALGILVSSSDAMAQGSFTPTPLFVPPLARNHEGDAPPEGSEALLALVEAAHQENLDADNLTLWQGGALGDVALASLVPDGSVGDWLSAIEVPLLNGGQFETAKAKGPVLVNFWASWCGPCRLELPLLLAAHNDPSAPFEVVLVNLWEDVASYRVFAQAQFPATMAVGRGPDDLAGRIGLRAIPTSLLLDREQRITAIHVGNITDAVMDLLYALAGYADEDTVPATAGAVAGQAETARLAALASSVEEANRAASAATAWSGGTLGGQDALEMAIAVGEKMPAFGLQTRNGQLFQLDLVGRPALVNFWASWCAPCEVEFPVLIAADRAALPFDVAFVNIWDEPYAYEAFLANYPADIRVMADVAGVLPALYHLEFIPVSILIDGDGIVRLIQRGAVSQAVIDFAAALLE